MWHQRSQGFLEGNGGACIWKPEYAVIYNKKMLCQKSQSGLRQNRQCVRCERISDPPENVSTTCLPGVPNPFSQLPHQVHTGNATILHGSASTVLGVVFLPFLLTFKLVGVWVCECVFSFLVYHL